MKVIFTTLLIAVAAALFTGCESELPPNRDGSAIERGIRGQGKLTQPDRSDDPVIRENTRVGY